MGYAQGSTSSKSGAHLPSRLHGRYTYCAAQRVAQCAAQCSTATDHCPHSYAADVR